MVNVLPQLAELKGAALDLLFPQWCVGCGREGVFICGKCLTTLSRIEPPLCPLCGRPQLQGLLCDACAGWEADIEGIRSPYKFDGVLRQAIHEFKYKNLRALAPVLAQLMNEYILENHLSAEVLVPVPLHNKRLRERGYNQSTLLAKELGRLTGLPVNENCLTRSHYHLPQAKTSNVQERRQNVRDAFLCCNDSLKDNDILLVDDVATSGATLNACASVLKAKGVRSVRGLTLAREI
jgi:ComF family protein